MDPKSSVPPEDQAKNQDQPTPANLAQPQPQTFAPAAQIQTIQPTQPTSSNPQTPPTVADSSTTQPPQQPTMPWDQPTNGSAQSRHPQKNKKKLALILLGLLGGLLVIGGGMAAAYFGVVVPNKPENILKQTMLNTLEQNAFTAKGNTEFSAAGTFSGKATYESQANLQDKAFAGKMNLTISGVDLPVEAKYVDKNVYIKVGDISTLSSLLSGYLGLAGADQAQVEQLVESVSKKVSNQWMVVDSTLLDQGGGSCIQDINFALTDTDKDLLKNQYEKNQFITIKNHQDEKVNGKDAIKYDLTLDGKKMTKYINNLDDLSLMKALEKCAKNAGGKLDDEISSEEDALPSSIPVTVWVDKDEKLITKTKYDITETASGTSGRVVAEDLISYEPVKITAPKDAKPIMQVWGELQKDFTNVFSDFFGDMSTEGGLGEMTDYPYNSVPQ